MNDLMVQTLWVCGALAGLTFLVVLLAYIFWYPRAPEEPEDNE